MMNHPPHADSQDTDGTKRSNLFLQQCSEHVMDTVKADGTGRVYGPVGARQENPAEEVVFVVDAIPDSPIPSPRGEDKKTEKSMAREDVQRVGPRHFAGMLSARRRPRPTARQRPRPTARQCPRPSRAVQELR